MQVAAYTFERGSLKNTFGKLNFDSVNEGFKQGVLVTIQHPVLS
jgi:hypothetical protein